MKSTKHPTQSELAQALRSEIQGKVFWRGWRGGSWHYWDLRREQWCHLPPSEMSRRIMQFLDAQPAFQSGYTFGLVTSIERLLRAHLGYHGSFSSKEARNPSLLAQVGEEALQ